MNWYDSLRWRLEDAEQEGLVYFKLWYLGLICDPDVDWACKSRLWLSFEANWIFFHFFYSELNKEIFMSHVHAWCTAGVTWVCSNNRAYAQLSSQPSISPQLFTSNG